MKFITASDWHLSHRGPASRTDDWQAALFAKLEQVATAARKLKARAILVPGDFFQEKSRVPFGLLVRVLTWCYSLKKDGIHVIGIPGNHDLALNRYESLTTQPLGLLIAAGAIIDCSFKVVKFTGSETRGVDAGDGKGYAEPLTCGIVGIPYPHATDPRQFEQLPAHGCTKGILLAHCFASPDGGSVFGEACHRYDQLAQLDFDAFVFGHDHSDHGVCLVAPRADEAAKLFVNVGAISRGALAKEEIKRDVKVAVLDVTFQGVIAQQLRLKVAPAEEVFDLALKAQKDRELAEIEQFAAKLAADLADAGPVSFIERAQKLDLPEEVRRRVLQYIQEAESAS